MHVCLFDIDGTILASGGAGKAALETALLREFGVIAQSERIQLSGRTDRSIIQDIFTIHGIPDTPENVQRFVAGYLRLLPESLATHHGRVLPGISQLLNELSIREDVEVGLLTGNLRRGAELKLGHYQLWDYFEFGGFGDQHLCRDDVAREALAEVCRRLNGAHCLDRIWVIGDTPLDVRCARAIGVKVAAIATGWHPIEELAQHEPDLLLEDLSDAGPLLAKWL